MSVTAARVGVGCGLGQHADRLGARQDVEVGLAMAGWGRHADNVVTVQGSGLLPLDSPEGYTNVSRPVEGNDEYSGRGQEREARLPPMKRRR
jgi:hypothetical protein